MPVERVEFFVEDRSMEAALGGLLPRVLPTIDAQVHSFQGKRDRLARESDLRLLRGPRLSTRPDGGSRPPWAWASLAHRHELPDGHRHDERGMALRATLAQGLRPHGRAQMSSVNTQEPVSRGHLTPAITRPSAESTVPRDGVEPPTRGFSVRCSTS